MNKYTPQQIKEWRRTRDTRAAIFAGLGGFHVALTHQMQIHTSPKSGQRQHMIEHTETSFYVRFALTINVQ